MAQKEGNWVWIGSPLTYACCGFGCVWVGWDGVGRRQGLQEGVKETQPALGGPRRGGEVNSGSKNYYTSPTGDLGACGPDTPDVCIWRGVWKVSLAESLMHPLNRALEEPGEDSFLRVGGVFRRPRWRA